MPVQTFAPPVNPVVGMTNKPEIKLWKADFGDGYVQSAPAGLNNVRAVYDLSWDGLSDADADTIVSFITMQLGCYPFHYTIPGKASPMLFTCESWSDQENSGGYHRVTATFRQSFTPVAA